MKRQRCRWGFFAWIFVLIAAGVLFRGGTAEARQPELAQGERAYSLPMELRKVFELEAQMDAQADEARRNVLCWRYQEVLTEVITGGLDRAGGRANRYASRKGNGFYLEQVTADYYRDAIHGNGDCRSSRILEEYWALLEESDFQIDDTIEEFYAKLPEIIHCESKCKNEKISFLTKHLVWLGLYTE